MRALLCFFIFTAFSTTGFSQNAPPAGRCKIKGRVVDSVSLQVVDYATVAVFPKGSSNVAGGMITDEKGQFTIDNLPAGEYTAKIDFIGYSTKTQTNIVLSEAHPVVNLGDIKISGNSKKLEEVTVTGSRNFMENHLDKFVYNVEKDVTSQGGVATDVLKKIPQVSIDVDGNVEMLGNGNIRVFINGKPSSMLDNNLADALQSIPAKQIKSIEIITSPGAQYDAQGTGGIINIILKDNKSRGVSGNISATAGTRLENMTGAIHVKEGNLEMSLSMLGNWTLRGTTPGSLDRQTDSGALKQTATGTYERKGALPQFGLNWDINKTNSITAEATYSNLELPGTNLVQQDKTGFYPPTDTQTVRNVHGNSVFRATDVNVNYKKKFGKDGQELNLSCQWNDGLGAVNYDQYETYILTNALAAGGMGNDNWNDRETYLTADYAHPVTKDVVLNVGVKGTLTRVNDNSNHSILDTASRLYIYDASQADNFIYNRDIYAAYASVTFPLLDVYQVKLGLRDEETITHTNDTALSNLSYNFFAPSFVISRKLNKNQTLKLSYTKRLQRPGFRTLNPFINAADPENLIQGNPALKPERVDVGELSYYKFFDKGSSILITAYEKYQRDDNQTYIQYYASLPVGDSIYRNVAVITTINASIEQMAGINISGTLALSQKFELRGSFNFFDKYIISHFDSTISNSFNYRISGNANYQFSKTLVAEIFYSFNSPRTEIQGRFPAYTNYSFAIRKLFFDKKLSIAFTTTDPFNAYTDQFTSIKGTNFTTTIDRKVPNQSFGISVNYKFGKMEYKEKKQERNDQSTDEGN